MLKKKSSFVIFSILWMLLAIAIASNFTEPTDSVHNLFTILNLISYGLCFYYWISSRCRVVSIYTLFVAYCLLSNLGQSVLYLFFVPDELLFLYSFVSFEEIVKMLRFQYLCISGLALGTALYVSKTSRCVSLKEQQEAYANSKPQPSPIDGILNVLLYISLGYFVLVSIRLIVMRQTMTYAEIFDAGRGLDQNLITSFIKYFYILLPLYFIFKKKHTSFILMVLLFAIAAFMYSGARGLAIPSFCILLITAPLVKPRLFQKKYVIVWILASFVFFASLSFLSFARSVSVGSGLDENKTMLGYTMSTVSEMGGSAIPAALTIEAVDNGSLHRYQTIAFTVIRAAIPFSSGLSFIKESDFNLSNWITNYANSLYSGLGFSCIGELYMNYGWFAWIFMIFWGWFIAYAENSAYKRLEKGKYLYALILLIIICTLVPWARDEFQRVQGTIRDSIYIAIIWGLFDAYIAKKTI